MEEPKQLSVSELRKKFESKPSTSSTPSTTKLIQSTTTQPPRQAFPGNTQPNVTTEDPKPATSQADTTNLSVKERMKMFDKSKNQQETQSVPPLQPKKTQVPPQATVNSNQNETNKVSAEPEKLIVSDPEPVQEEHQQEIPQEPTQKEEVHQAPEQVQEIPQEEIAHHHVVAEEVVPEVHEEKAQEVVEEVQEPIKEPEVIQEPEVVQEKQEEQAPIVVVEKEETKATETKNLVLNRNAGFASEMNAMLAKKGLRSNEDSPIKPEHSRNQGLSSEDAYTEALLTRPTSDPRKKKAKLVFVDDEDF